MSNEAQNDPLEFMKGMWGNMGFSLPGMVTPTFDVDELEKRIHDLKAVEGWLRMNLSMLQMTIQGLEMQRTTLGAVQAMGQIASDTAKAMNPEAAGAPVAVDPEKNAFSDAALWPWQMMQQMRDQMQQAAEAAVQATNAKEPAAGPATDRGKTP